MTPVCGKCGDTGYAEILVCCFMCQDAYEHRYCFHKASDIFREDVKWACEDCLQTIPNKPTPKKNRNSPSTPSRRSERISSRNNPASNASVADKPAVETSPPDAKRTKRRSESSNEMERLEPLNMDGSPECNQSISCILEKNENKDVQTPSEIEGKVTELVTETSESLSNAEEKGLLGGTLWIDLPCPGSPTFDDTQPVMSHQNHNCHARPIMDPVWKGSFRICYKKFSRIESVAAHLSTLVCPKAQQEARLLPISLHLRIVPRSIVWPKSFQKAEPKGESIGLYFFPEMDRDGKTYDSLVDGMISEDLAMICVVENAELLVFTSVKLPCDYWRFQGRRYLWGVFRAKQSLPSSQSPKRRP